MRTGLLAPIYDKSNFKTILEKANFYNSPLAIINDNVRVKNVNICHDGSRASSCRQAIAQLRTQGLDIPEIFCFYARQQEQFCLQDWIIKQRCRLISILGITGIGKTSLGLHFIKQILSF